MKNALKKYTPTIYRGLCRIKDMVLPPRRTWGKYYDASPEYKWLHEPERCLVELKDRIPPHIDMILNLGCGAGRDFIPFDGELKLWGLDIVPFERIHWIRSFKNLRYTQTYLQDFTKELENGRYDLTNVLVYSCGTLMYLSKSEQERFFAAAKKAGATEFLFEEYPKGFYEPGQDFKLNPSLFTQLSFRGPREPHVYTTLRGIPSQLVQAKVI